MQNFRCQRQLETHIITTKSWKYMHHFKVIFSAFVFVQGVCLKFHNFWNTGYNFFKQYLIGKGRCCSMRSTIKLILWKLCNATHFLVEDHYIIYTIDIFFFGLSRPSSRPIAFRNVLKCSTLHSSVTIRFWHFSSAAFIEKNRRTGTYG